MIIGWLRGGGKGVQRGRRSGDCISCPESAGYLMCCGLDPVSRTNYYTLEQSRTRKSSYRVRFYLRKDDKFDFNVLINRARTFGSSHTHAGMRTQIYTHTDTHTHTDTQTHTHRNTYTLPISLIAPKLSL